MVSLKNRSVCSLKIRRLSWLVQAGEWGFIESPRWLWFWTCNGRTLNRASKLCLQCKYQKMNGQYEAPCFWWYIEQGILFTKLGQLCCNFLNGGWWCLCLTQSNRECMCWKMSQYQDCHRYCRHFCVIFYCVKGTLLKGKGRDLEVLHLIAETRKSWCAFSSSS